MEDITKKRLVELITNERKLAQLELCEEYLLHLGKDARNVLEDSVYRFFNNKIKELLHKK